VLSDRLTTQIFGLVDVEAIVADALPPRGQILAGPLTGGIEDFVREKVDEVLSSDDFGTVGSRRIASPIHKSWPFSEMGVKSWR